MNDANASVRVERNGDTSVLMVSFIVNGKAIRNGVSIPDGATGKYIADRLDVLSYWIGERVKGK